MTSDDRERYEQIYRWGVEMGKVRMDLSANMSKLYAAEKRVAELEARLAAQEWRPVTELPTEPGTYLVYDADGEPYLFAGVWPYRVAKWDNGWGSGLDGLVDYWRPLPAPPHPNPPAHPTPPAAIE